MSRLGDWMITFTGKKYWPLDPRPEDVCTEDIAHHLSMICRYGGACKYFYSVAQHSVILSQLLEQERESIQTLQWGLLHDAAEAYVGDTIRPIKRSLQEMRIIEERNIWAISNAYNLKVSDRVVLQKVSHMDDALLFLEAESFMEGGTKDLEYKPQRSLPPMGKIGPGLAIEPLCPMMAEQLFLGRYKELFR